MAIRLLVWNLIVSIHIIHGLSIFPFFQKQTSTSAATIEKAAQTVGQSTDPAEICTGPVESQQCRNTVLLNKARVTRKHPQIVDIPGERTVGIHLTRRLCILT